MFLYLSTCIKQPPALIGPGFDVELLGFKSEELRKFPDYVLVLIKAHCNPLFSKFSYSQSIKKL